MREDARHADSTRDRFDSSSSDFAKGIRGPALPSAGPYPIFKKPFLSAMPKSSVDLLRVFPEDVPPEEELIRGDGHGRLTLIAFLHVKTPRMAEPDRGYV
jgi:hypothetical protein